MFHAFRDMGSANRSLPSAQNQLARNPENGSSGSDGEAALLVIYDAIEDAILEAVARENPSHDRQCHTGQGTLAASGTDER